MSRDKHTDFTEGWEKRKEEKQKQIEEMARFMLEKSNSANVEPIFTASDGTQIVLGEKATKLLDDVLEQAFIPFLAECLVKADYRKASDVAREIFEEIDKRFEALLKFYPCNGEFEDAKRFVDFHWKHIRHSIMCDYDADLKKKHESEGAENA